ncbi:MAG: histidinol dehydrogenase [Candidatus Hydrogenedentes bacterium]|nr:histidinol dehydrogenase [Candidatus Hydrogenedentota bacterium]
MNNITVLSDADFDSTAAHLLRLKHDTEADRVIAQKIDATRAIVNAVRELGDDAVADYTKRFDGVDLSPERFEVAPDEIAAAAKDVDPDLVRSLERAHDNIRRFHSKNLRESWEEELEDGTILGQRISAIESVGVYVPGGKAFYPSSVLMNIVPARVAGVGEIVMVSPPSYEGGIHPAVLTAAKIAGATRVFRIGGAQAVAALAYGTETIPQVLKITGPGNTFVTAAKSIVRGVVDIDTEAGPSEVTVIADDSANPRLVAGEMLAQAEHDEETTSILIATSEDLCERVAVALDDEVGSLSRKDIIQKALNANGAMIVVRDLDEAAKLSNLIGPEHLAIYTQDPRYVYDRITSAGSIMLGESTSVVLGDYIAGPNHILPTGRRARFASPLTAEDFRKVSSVLSYTPERVKEVGGDVMRLAKAEGLTAHARAIEMRQ